VSSYCQEIDEFRLARGVEILSAMMSTIIRSIQEFVGKPSIVATLASTGGSFPVRQPPVSIAATSAQCLLQSPKTFAYLPVPLPLKRLAFVPASAASPRLRLALQLGSALRRWSPARFD
jgi:hypothetical protein